MDVGGENEIVFGFVASVVVAILAISVRFHPVSLTRKRAADFVLCCYGALRHARLADPDLPFRWTILPPSEQERPYFFSPCALHQQILIRLPMTTTHQPAKSGEPHSFVAPDAAVVDFVAWG